MGLLYVAAFENITFTDAAQDFVFLQAASGKPITVHEILMTSSTTTDVRARVSIVRRTTAGSAGTGITPRALDEHNTQAAGATATYARTTVGTVGNVLDADAWSLLVPYQKLYTPETRIRIAAAGFLGVNLTAATGATRVVSGKIVFEE